jgi:hypothetical protein
VEVSTNPPIVLTDRPDGHCLTTRSEALRLLPDGVNTWRDVL